MKSTLKQSLAASSQSAYNKYWQDFTSFMTNTLGEHPVPASDHSVSLYIVHLNARQLQTSSIRNYLSAIAFVHKLHNMPDPTSSFLIQKLLDALKKGDPSKQTRHPITEKILHDIIDCIKIQFNDRYLRCMYTCIFMFMYHACMRVSEIANTKTSNHALQFDQVSLHNSTLYVKFKSYKHSRGMEATAKIKATQGKYCPVKIYRNYVRIRGSKIGNLFINPDGSTLNRSTVARVLQEIMSGFTSKPTRPAGLKCLGMKNECSVFSF